MFTNGDAWERWTPIWGLFFWVAIWLILALWSPWTWLAPWKTPTKPDVTVSVKDNPITVEGLVRTSKGELLKDGGRVDVVVRDVVASQTVFVGTATVDATGSFKISDDQKTDNVEQTAIDQTSTQQRVLEVQARFIPKGKAEAGSVSTDPSATQRNGTVSGGWVRFILVFALIFLVALLYLFVAPPTTKRVTALFAFGYFVVLFSFLFPFALTYALTQDEALVEQMKKSPVGLVEAVNGERRDWFVRVGGDLRQPAEPGAAAEPADEATSTPEPEAAAAPTTPSPAEGSSTQVSSVGTLEGGVGVPIWVLVLAAFGASLAMAREIPKLQRDCPTWVMPDPRFPTASSRIVGGLTLGMFGAEPTPPSADAGKRLGRARKRVIELYLNIVAAPFLAIAVYYLIQAVSGDTLQPTFVVIAFATGLFSDVFVAKIKKFIASRGEEAEEDAAAALQPGASEGAAGEEADEHLDGCDVDMTTDAVADEDLLQVVFGDSEEKAEEYAELLKRDGDS